MPVDLVYTWVDGHNPDYLKIYNQYAEIPRDLNPERIRDSYHTLKYSLRSVEKYLPWIRTIYIVTARPQIPDWIDLENPKVQLIHHDEIIDPQYLPTFNYNTIESFIYKIPGLSEYFLYSCDDFLFGNEVTIHDFLKPMHRIRIFGTFVGENLKFRIYERKHDIVSMGRIEHNPILYKKSIIEELQDHYSSEFFHTRNSRFRRDDNITMQKVFKQWMLTHHRKLSDPINVFELSRIHTFHKITNKLAKQKRRIQKLEQKKPKFYCLNDDQGDLPNKEVVKLIRDFLDRNYPDKSQFEI